VRTPSETLRLEWTDIYWDVSKFKVTSPKTEHHEGKAERLVPIFPELLPYLREAFEQAPEGARYVINRTRDPKVNWRTRLLKIIRRAGLTPWPKPFQNMRATRETELADEYPAHVVTAWIGNSERVATDHYLQITEEHWKSAAESGAVALQKAVQQGVSPTLTESQDLTQVLANCDSVRDGERICDIKEHARRDANPPPQVIPGKDLGQQHFSGGALSGAVLDGCQCDSDLAQLIQAWPNLPADVKSAIVNLVRMATVE
jgi:hypothetical protein